MIQRVIRCTVRAIEDRDTESVRCLSAWTDDTGHAKDKIYATIGQRNLLINQSRLLHRNILYQIPR